MDLVRWIVDRVLDLLVGQRCPGCGIASTRSPCATCRGVLDSRPHVRAGVWPDDRSVASRLVRSAKHGTWRGAHGFYARSTVARLGPWLDRVDAVTWVPADPGRRARRGGCLPERYARALARELGVSSLPLVERVPGSGSQRGRGRADRRRNAARSYRPRRRRRLPASVRHVLVVDDVRTTGATLAAVSAQIRGVHGVRTSELAIVAVDRMVREPGVSPRKSRTERGISAHDPAVASRYVVSRPVKGSRRT